MDLREALTEDLEQAKSYIEDDDFRSAERVVRQMMEKLEGAQTGTRVQEPAEPQDTRPWWKIDIDRPVITYERFTRFVQADTEEAARELAEAMSVDANDAGVDPEGIGSTNHDPDYEKFDVDSVSLADEDDLSAAYPYEIIEQ